MEYIGTKSQLISYQRGKIMGESDRIKLYFSIFVFKKCGSYKKNRFPPLNVLNFRLEYNPTKC